MTSNTDPDHVAPNMSGSECTLFAIVTINMKEFILCMHLLLSADFFQNQLFQKTLPGTLLMSNCLDPDQDRQYVGPDLGPDCLQRLSISRRHVAACKEGLKKQRNLKCCLVQILAWSLKKVPPFT